VSGQDPRRRLSGRQRRGSIFSCWRSAVALHGCRSSGL